MLNVIVFLYSTGQKNVTTDYICDYTEEVPTVLSEVRNDGITIDYTYGETRERLEAVVTSTSVYNQTQMTYNISTDERGSSRWAMDDMEYVVAKTSYDAWGNVEENTALSLSPYIDDINLTESFTGYIYDSGTGLWNAGARTIETVISFEAHVNTFVKDTTVAKNLQNIAKVSTRPSPITVNNVREVGFRKEWWEFWKQLNK